MAHTKNLAMGDVKDVEISPILAVDRLHVVALVGRYYDLDHMYCLYCGENGGLGGWQFVCDNCQEDVARGRYSPPASFISYLFLEMFGETANTKELVRRRPPGVEHGAVHNG